MTKVEFGFDDAAAIFLDRVVSHQDSRRDYGETRIKAIGEAKGRILAVIYTDRGEIRWIISARLANRKERTQWRARPSSRSGQPLPAWTMPSWMPPPRLISSATCARTARTPTPPSAPSSP